MVLRWEVVLSFRSWARPDRMVARALEAHRAAPVADDIIPAPNGGRPRVSLLTVQAQYKTWLWVWDAHSRGLLPTSI
jgi:hypothetical protein